MNAADPFTRACPRWTNAVRLGARAGDPIQVWPRRRRPLPFPVKILALASFGLMLALLVLLWGKV